MAAEFSEQKKISGKWLWRSMGGIFLFAFIIWGSGIFSAEHNAPSFFADIKDAFSATFLYSETFRGEFDFSENRKNVLLPAYNEKCAFDTIQNPSRTTIIFNEVAWMGTKEDYRDEWIELKNLSDKDIDISGWTLIDRGGDISVSFSKENMVRSGALLVLKKGKEREMFSGSLKNRDEFVRLFDASCVLQDEIGGEVWIAGDNATKRTMERDVGGFGWHTSISPGGTPGDKNSNFQFPISKNTEAEKDKIKKNKEYTEIRKSEIQDSVLHATTTKGIIEIIEVITGTEGNAGYEFIRLRSGSDGSIDLSGWTIKKRSSTGNETTLVSSTRLEGKKISPDSDFLLAHEGEYSGNPEPDVWWPKSYTLADKNNTVILYDVSGEIMSEYAW